jgi:dipeptidyl aminopeptidase/acylaminoacyl peptidase
VSAPSDTGATPFHDLARYVAIPRVTALRLAPDGSWLAAAVQTLAPDRKKYLTSIWRIPASPASPASQEAPRQLTRSPKGEKNPRFLPDGSLLFISERPGAPAGTSGSPGSSQAPDEPADPGRDDLAAGEQALWLLPADGGEAVWVAGRPGGISAAETAGRDGVIVCSAAVMPGAGADPADDARLRREREQAGVTAILHEAVPVRYWDHDLGPAQLRLFAAAAPETPETSGQGGDSGDSGVSGDSGDPEGAARALPRELTPAPGRALDEQSFCVSADGTTVASGWWRWEDGGDCHAELAVIDVPSGARRTALSAPGFDYEHPAIAPDGRHVACIRSAHHTPDGPGDVTIVLVGCGPGGGGERDLLAGFDRRPVELAWAPDSKSLYFTADDRGRRPVFRVQAGTDDAAGEVARISADDGAYTDLCPASDGRCIFALRSSVGEPPTPVRLEAAAGQKPERLVSPGSPLALPGRLTEIETAADDGMGIRSWLVLPGTASVQTPAPLVLWVHGGPMSSWNSWSWRWNPWLLAARGYAVLLPDPALSTGYGQDFIARAYHQWGGRPFADVMAATDAAVARPDIDGSRTAMMGGSYGGYMANWAAGHTDRFRAIVSHASLWVLDQMFGTTDLPMFWRPQFGDPLTAPERYEANSPHRHIASIRTPMLVIHGNKDYRVPVGEALRLWWDLSRHGADAKFLYFPDENHWILSPGHAALWYDTVFAFLAQHVLGEPWRRPELLLYLGGRPPGTPRCPARPAQRAPRWYFAETPATHRAQGPVRWAGNDRLAVGPAGLLADGTGHSPGPSARIRQAGNDRLSVTRDWV